MIISSAVCPHLHDPTNGDVSVATYFVGGIASYMCNPGYDLDGSSSLTCQSNQRWSGTEPTCRGGSYLHVMHLWIDIYAS